MLFGTVLGPVEVLAFLTSVALAALLRHERSAALPPLAGAVCFGIAIAVWAISLNPINAELSGWTAATLPDTWRAVRVQWELSHAAHAGFVLVGFVALILGALADRARTRGLPATSDEALAR